MSSENNRAEISRVYRSKKQAKESYDKLSRFYDYFAGIYEKKYREITLERLRVVEGETVLEVAFGTGHSLKQIAELVGQAGKVYGIDISSGMLEVTRKRLQKAGLTDRAELFCGDAVKMPYRDNMFDAAFISFALELFDTPEIPKVLGEIRRVLKPQGRLGVVGMSKENGASLLLRVYEWLHKKLPQYVDCRPIYVEQSIKEAAFEIKYKEKVKLFGLPGEIVVGVKSSQSDTL
jgi:ubiquinone/menaquinone biosynthesis C-methylase UbiE